MCKCTINKNQGSHNKNCLCGCHDTCHDTGVQKPCPQSYEREHYEEETTREDYSKRR